MTQETALVTGATSGIGWAVAHALAARGATVGVLGRRRERAEALVEEIRHAGKGRAIPLVADVSNPEEIEAAIAGLVGQTGRLDTVVSSAGIAFNATLTETSIEDWKRLQEVNLGGTFYLARACMPHLAESRGTFTAVASDAGTQGAVGYAAYCASKHGVIGLVRAIALEWGPAGVRCNVVAPGFVETPMADALLTGVSDAERKFYEKSVPIGRFARPEEVADAVAHLSSSSASYVNGMVYAIDGGATAGYFSAA